MIKVGQIPEWPPIQLRKFRNRKVVQSRPESETSGVGVIRSRSHPESVSESSGIGDRVFRKHCCGIELSDILRNKSLLTLTDSGQFRILVTPNPFSCWFWRTSVDSHSAWLRIRATPTPDDSVSRRLRHRADLMIPIFPKSESD